MGFNMAENKDSKALTHNAYALKRETRVSGRWLDIGGARFKFDVARLPDHLKHLIPHLPELLKALQGYVFLDRTPIGGFNGEVYLAPAGVKPEDPKPQRPAQAGQTTEEEEEF